MISRNRTVSDENALEFLLAFDGHVHHLEQGYWLRFVIRRGEATPQRPHGLRYSFTLHDRNGKRVMGFDNAHGVSSRGARFRRPVVAHDHWHRTGDDAGRPYRFTSVDQLLTDFEAEVERVLGQLGISTAVIGESDSTARGSR